MADVAQSDEVREAIAGRARDLFRQQERAIRRRTDRLFAALLALEWVALLAVSSRIAPMRWGAWDSPVLQAGAIGGAFVAGPILLALCGPGWAATRHVVAAGQMLMSALLIHLGGNRGEAHFHVFGLLALLALYRDGRVLATGTLVVVADQCLRATLAPAGSWPWVEYLGWIGFEDAFLILLCVQGVSEMKQAAGRQAGLEGARARIEQTVALRNAELTYQADELTLLGHRLRQSEAEARKLALVASRAEHAAILTDALGRIEWVNDGFTRLLGYTLAEVLGRTPTSFLPPGDPGLSARIWSRIRKGEVVHAELIVATKGGGRRRVAAEVHPIQDDPGTLIRFRALDAESEADPGAGPRAGEAPRPAEAIRTAGEDAGRARGELLAEIGRELRARIDDLIGPPGAPGEAPDEGNGASADGLRAFLDDLDDLAGIEAGRLRLDASPFALRDALAEALRSLGPDARPGGPALVQDVRPDVPDALIGDAPRLRQVLAHLVGEAIRSADRDRGEVVTRVTLDARDASRVLLHLAVTDAGAGTPPEPRRGGLGLALATRLIGLMGGRLWVEGEPGRGGTSHFTVEFKADLDATPRRPAALDARPIFANGPPRSWATVRPVGASSKGG